MSDRNRFRGYQSQRSGRLESRASRDSEVRMAAAAGWPQSALAAPADHPRRAVPAQGANTHFGAGLDQTPFCPLTLLGQRTSRFLSSARVADVLNLSAAESGPEIEPTRERSRARFVAGTSAIRASRRTLAAVSASRGTSCDEIAGGPEALEVMAPSGDVGAVRSGLGESSVPISGRD
jgi:hypothetical protein